MISLPLTSNSKLSSVKCHLFTGKVEDVRENLKIECIKICTHISKIEYTCDTYRTVRECNIIVGKSQKSVTLKLMWTSEQKAVCTMS